MSSYPEGAEEGYPINDEYSSYREEYNTRVITTDGFKNSLKKSRKRISVTSGSMLMATSLSTWNRISPSVNFEHILSGGWLPTIN